MVSKEKGAYRLLRQTSGYGSFARVEVACVERAGVALSMDLDALPLAEWVDAAAQGCTQAIDLLKDLNPGERGVEITLVVGTHVDTTPDAMSAVAAMATAQALGCEGRLELRREQHGWCVARVC